MTAQPSPLAADPAESASPVSTMAAGDAAPRTAAVDTTGGDRPLPFKRAEALRKRAAEIAAEEGRALSTAAGYEVPGYLEETYGWAYLNPVSVWLLDRPAVVYTILWGQAGRLQAAAAAEIEPGQRVLQPAGVYGGVSRILADKVGSRGRLHISDVAPVQVANCRRKMADYPQVTVGLADARAPGDGIYDAVCCFFLLHEVPDDCKHAIVDALLGRVPVGGRVVFVDYHRPHWAHPLKPVMSVVCDRLEPFAKGLWRREITDFAAAPERFAWRKETYFGGLYQKVVAERES